MEGTHLASNPCYGQEHQVAESPIQSGLVQASYRNAITRSAYLTVLPPCRAGATETETGTEAEENSIHQLSWKGGKAWALWNNGTTEQLTEWTQQLLLLPSPCAALPVSTAPWDNPNSLNAALTLQWFLPSWGKVFLGERTSQFTNHIFNSSSLTLGKKRVSLHIAILRGFFFCQ